MQISTLILPVATVALLLAVNYSLATPPVDCAESESGHAQTHAENAPDPLCTTDCSTCDAIDAEDCLQRRLAMRTDSARQNRTNTPTYPPRGLDEAGEFSIDRYLDSFLAEAPPETTTLATD